MFDYTLDRLPAPTIFVAVPLSYTIDTINRIVRVRVEGVLTEDDLMAARERLRADPAFDPAFAQYMDLRQATDVALSASTIEFISGLSVFTPGVKRAFVAEKPVHIGMARMYGLWSELHNQNVRVFRDATEAEIWLASDDEPTR
jgi:hypothetical protein